MYKISIIIITLHSRFTSYSLGSCVCAANSRIAFLYACRRAPASAELCFLYRDQVLWVFFLLVLVNWRSARRSRQSRSPIVTYSWIPIKLTEVFFFSFSPPATHSVAALQMTSAPAEGARLTLSLVIIIPSIGSPSNGDYRVWWDWMKREKELDGWMFPTAINITPNETCWTILHSLEQL